MKCNRIGMAILAVSVMAAGCARISAHVVEKPRVDQEIGEGNRGFLMGTPSAVAESRAKTRQVIETNIEMATLGEMDPWRARKASAPLVPAASAPSAAVPVEVSVPRETNLEETATVATPIVSMEQEVKSEPVSTTYKVKSGDTLEKIAVKVYGDAGQWRRIYDANRDVMKSPNRLYPGQKLVIPPASSHKKHHKSHDTSGLK